MSRLNHFRIITLLIVCLFFSPLYAQQILNTASKAQLFLEHKIGSPDSKINIALVISMKPSWHTYWKNPGDVGQSLKAQWKLPQSVEVKELRWPPPQRIYYDKWINFGYKNKLTLTTHIFIPKKYSEKSLPIKLKAKWVICKDVCIPQEQMFSINIPIQEKSVLNNQNASIFKKIKSRKNVYESIQGQINQDGDQIKIQLTSKNPIDVIDFFPLSTLPLAKPSIDKKSDTEFTLTFKDPADRKVMRAKALIVFKKNNQTASKIIKLKEEQKDIVALLLFILMAFVGGLILNAMPCVLPVVFLKFYHVAQKSSVNKRALILSSLAYSLGIVISFLFLALLINILKTSGDFVGWGFQMQSPLFVMGLILFFSFLGFNFLGFFNIPHLLKMKKADSSNLVENFSSGLLATVAASPCTAPFMGAAIGYAFLQSTFSIILIFTSLGLGMASPYVVLCFFPKLLKKIPKWEKWSQKLKQSMAFAMFATTLWLLYVMANLSGTWTIFPILSALMGLGFSFWIWDKKLHIILKSINLFIFSFSTFVILFLSYVITTSTRTAIEDIMEVKEKTEVHWEKFSTLKLDKLRTQKQHVLVNFTAEWCLTCKVNKWTAFKDDDFKNFIKENKITLLEGDWTFHNPEIAQTLKKYARAGVPFTAFFPANQNKVIILPELLTVDIIKEKIRPHL